MAKALLRKNAVVQIAEEEFEVSPSLKWVDGTGAQIGWKYDEELQKEKKLDSPFIDPDTRTDEEKFNDARESLRAKRGFALRDSDWTQANDTQLTDANVAKWKTYRQELRDLTKGLTTEDEVNTVTWPTEPS